MSPLPSQLIARWATQEEGQFFERKSAYERDPPRQRNPRDTATDIAETVVAMANADGGEVILGIEDDGGVTGVPYVERTLRLLENANRERISPPAGARVSRIAYDELLLMRFEVAPSPQVHRLTDGRYLLRVRDSNVPFAADQIAALKTSKTQGLWERGYPVGADLDALDASLMSGMVERLRFDGPPTDLLIEYRLADRRDGALIPNYACLLLFGKEPDRWHPRCGIDFRRYSGTEPGFGRGLNLVGRETIVMPVSVLIEQAFHRIRPHIRERHVLHDLFFHERFEYPTFAWQEALVNAVAHRDYSIQGAHTELLMFDDHLDVRSPGLPPQPVTFEALRNRSGIHVSRNPLMVRVLTALGFMREIGEGIPRMFEAMEREGLYPPELDAVGGAVFRVLLRNTPVYDREILDWLKRFDAAGLTPDQRRLLAYARTHEGTFTSRAYQQLAHKDIYSASRDIRDLMRKGIARLRRPRGRVYELAPTGELEVPPEFAPVARLIAEQGRVTNADIRRLLSADRHRARHLAQKWIERGLLRLEGRGRGARYAPGPALNRHNEHV